MTELTTRSSTSICRRIFADRVVAYAAGRCVAGRLSGMRLTHCATLASFRGQSHDLLDHFEEQVEQFTTNYKDLQYLDIRREWLANDMKSTIWRAHQVLQ
eukprot:715027-Heterocapsa_arctica.AAC.1